MLSLASFFSPNSPNQQDVRQAYKDWKAEDPNAAQDRLDMNTDAMIGILDDAQFYGEDRAHHPLSKQGLEDLPYRGLFVPMGFENKEYFWTPKGEGVAGAYTSDDYGGNERTAVPGGALIDTLIHEGRHPLIQQNKKTEELTNRGYDYFDALANKDPERIKSTLNYIVQNYGSDALGGLFSQYGGVPASL